MNDRDILVESERDTIAALSASLNDYLVSVAAADDYAKIETYITAVATQEEVPRDLFGLNPLLVGLQTAKIVVDELHLGRDATLAVILYYLADRAALSNETMATTFGTAVVALVEGLRKVQDMNKLYGVSATENFRNLLLSCVDDLRVVLIMIADRVNLMRQIRDTPDSGAQRKMAEEAANLYAPLAHKLGLYRLKSELEDLSVKYLEHDTYYMIRDNLATTKAAREAYIDAFIAPVKAELEKAGLVFHIKGRTKSIHSIWQKMKKQQCGYDGIYDLFAIRIILAAEAAHEKMVCWQAFSIVTNMYQSNPQRMRDWLSVPKSNGYESLHITVLGSENKWVEVQIRTERMDDIAEHGIAAHWRYKGIRDAGSIDTFLSDIRQVLEAEDSSPEMLDQLRQNFTDKEVYVFTPKGDLYKLTKGATALDFAYHIHTNVGNHCTGAKINGRIVSLREELHSGDHVEILTQSNQAPKQDWLGIVRTARAKAKLRLALKETQKKETLVAKELLARRLKNRKIDMEEGIVAHTAQHMGYKVLSTFFMEIANGHLDVNKVVDKYIEERNYVLGLNAPAAAKSASEFSLEASPTPAATTQNSGDVLVIDKNLKGVDYSLARCCNPIYGDDIFGFVPVSGGIKIHRCDCPNAPALRSRYGYRILAAQWSGKGQSQYAVTLRVIGHDDIGIVNNITSIISKEEKTVIRSINIDANDGLFAGVIVLMVADTTKMNLLMKKISTVKGVKHVERI